MNSRIRLYNMSMSIQSCHALKLPLILASAKAHCPDGSRKPESKINAPGSGNYQSDVAKENARLKRELRDTKDALEILKKAISILGE